MKRLLALFLIAFFLGAPCWAKTDYYASPTALSSGTGTLANPWKLGTAIGCGQLPHGGDTIWLRGGTYPGVNTLCVSGNANAPLIISNYQNEHVILDGGASGGGTAIFLLTGNGYVWLWGHGTGGGGIELTSTDPVRVSAYTLSTPPDITRPDAFACYQRTNPDGTPVLRPGFKVIGVVDHDARQGIANWEECTNLEFADSISYHHGWHAPDRGHGHGTYSHNKTPSQKKLRGNIIFSSFGLGHQIYGSSDINLDNFDVGNNILFNCGSMEPTGGSHCLLYGGYFGPQYVGANVHDNALYRTGQTGNQDFDLGYVAGAGLINPIVTNNKIAASVANIATTNMTFTGNTIWSADITPSTMPATFPSNTWNGASGGRSSTSFFYYASAWDPGRCHIAAYNWSLGTTVAADMSQCGLTNGTAYQVQAATNFFGPSVTTFTYNSQAPTVTLPSTALALPVVAPVNWTTPADTCPEFCVYVVVPTGAGSATPTATATGTFTPSSSPTASNTPTITNTASNTPTKTNTPLFTPSNTDTPTVTNTPTRTNTPAPGTCTYIEAESGDVQTPMQAFSDALASGGQGVSSTLANSGTVTFHLDGGAGGAVKYLWHRVQAVDGSHDSYFVSFNGASDAAEIDDVAEQTQSALWQITRQTDRSISGCNPQLPGNPAACQPGYTLIAGDNTFRFRGREVDTRMDWLAVCPDQTQVPSVQTPTPTRTNTATPTATATPTPTTTPSNTPGSVCVTATATPTP